MTFKQAVKKLKSVAGDQYRSLQYEKTYCRGGTEITYCTIYLSSTEAIYRGNTWDEAFMAVDKGLHPENYVEKIPNE